MPPHVGVEFKTNTVVTGADVKAHTLTTETGDTISYEKLIVATGSGVRVRVSARVWLRARVSVAFSF